MFTHPLQVLPQVGEEFKAAIQDVLLLLGQIVHLITLDGQQGAIEGGPAPQFPELVQEVDMGPWEPQALGDVLRVDQAVELILQLLQLLLSLARFLQRGGALFQPGLIALRAATVLGAVGLEANLVILCQDGAHLQAVVEGAGDVKGHDAGGHGALREGGGIR